MAAETNGTLYINNPPAKEGFFLVLIALYLVLEFFLSLPRFLGHSAFLRFQRDVWISH